MDSTARKTPGRNDLCPCQSGKKYKQCCLDKDEAAARVESEKTRVIAAKAAAGAPPKDAPSKDAPPEGKPRRGHENSGHMPGKQTAAGNRGFQKATGTPRKVGGG